MVGVPVQVMEMIINLETLTQNIQKINKNERETRGKHVPVTYGAKQIARGYFSWHVAAGRGSAGAVDDCCFSTNFKTVTVSVLRFIFIMFDAPWLATSAYSPLGWIATSVGSVNPVYL